MQDFGRFGGQRKLRPGALDHRGQSPRVAAWDFDVDNVAEWVDAITAEACEGLSRWRTVEIFPQKGPVDVELTWSSGGGGNKYALISCARGTRVSVNCRTIKVRVRSRHNEAQNVGVTIIDGFTDCRNQYEPPSPETENEGNPGTAAVGISINDPGFDLDYNVFDVPPFATHVRLEVADDADAPNIAVSTVNSAVQAQGTYIADSQPAGGIPIGTARYIFVTGNTGAQYRLVFTLSI